MLHRGRHGTSATDDSVGGAEGDGGGGGGDGRASKRPLRWGPSHSPENSFLDRNGSARFLSYDVALDLGVMAHTARALDEAVAARQQLGQSSASDEELRAQLASLMRRLPHGGAPALDADGGLAEWGGGDTGRDTGRDTGLAEWGGGGTGDRLRSLGARSRLTAAVMMSSQNASAPLTSSDSGGLSAASRTPSGHSSASPTSADEGHRHWSHLYPLHPGGTIDPLVEPALAAAARASLERRLRHGGGHTGWSAAWAVSLWARLGEGGLAHAALRHTLHEFTSPALLGLHPPLKGRGGSVAGRCVTCVGRSGGTGEGVFQLDANSGAAAGVAEMLLQSHSARCQVHLLPALPPTWTEGAAHGLRARGAIAVDVRWAGGRLRSAAISRTQPSEPGAQIVLPARGATVSVCCASRVCGNEQAELEAAARASIRAITTHPATVWSWEILLEGTASWTMKMAA